MVQNVHRFDAVPIAGELQTPANSSVTSRLARSEVLTGSVTSAGALHPDYRHGARGWQLECQYTHRSSDQRRSSFDSFHLYVWVET
jgi:hypothetical protein